MTTLKPVTTVRKRAGRWGEVPDGFDAAVADVVFDRVAKCATDAEAALYGSALLGAMLQHDLLNYGDEIAKAGVVVLAKRISDMTDQLARTAIAKSRAGDTHAGDVAVEALGQLITMAKAFDDPQDLAERARRQHRDLQSGRFVVEHHDIQYVTPNQGARPLGDAQAKAMGIKLPKEAEWKKMPRAQKMLYHQAYKQIEGMIGNYRHVGDNGVLHLRYNNGTADTHSIPKIDERMPISTAKGKYVTRAELSVIPPLHGTTDLGSELALAGHPGAYNAVQGGALNADRLHQYSEAVKPRENDQFIPSSGVFRRLGETSSLLADSLSDVAPRKLQLALKIGQHAGTFGPEAQRVIGPTADKFAYRYRGTEKPADRSLMMAVANDKGINVRGGEDQDGDWVPSHLLSYFHSTKALPRADLNTLHTKAGNVPPSRGIIIDRTGKVASESVGYADDHYLPFNLKKLAALKGGQYVRTRTWGGPTTEDIYAGLVSGAKSMTVVSHNGVYTVDFDDSLRGKRRFNDKAARMVGRYGHLLDAVRNGHVETAEIDPSRMAELRDEVNQRIPERYDPKGFRAELRRRERDERRSPTLSKTQQAQATINWLDKVAATRQTRDGSTQNAQEMINDLATAKATAMRNKHAREGGAMGALEDYRAAELRRLGSDDPVEAGRKVADELGMRPQLDAAMKRAEEQNRQTLKELSLNGPGYDVALQALQEQFPYYIKDVSYHPWVADSPGGADTGYVRPGRLRPQEALAGYFDPVLGGKWAADSTRWQDPRGPQRPERGGGAAPIPRDDDEDTGYGEQRNERPRDEAAEKALQTAAATDVARHLQDPGTKFAGEDAMKLPDAAQRKYLAGATVRDKAKDLAASKAYEDLAHVVATPIAEQLRDRDSFVRRIKNIVEQSDALGFGIVPPQAAREFRGANERAGKAALNNVDEMLNNPDGEYELPHPAFRKNSGERADAIQRAYRADPDIDHSIREHALPATLDDEDAFRSAASKRLGRLRATHRHDLEYQANRTATPPADAALLPIRARALVKANQLHRRLGDAKASEAADRQRRIDEAGVSEHVYDFRNLTPEQQEGMRHLADLSQDPVFAELSRQLMAGGTAPPSRNS